MVEEVGAVVGLLEGCIVYVSGLVVGVVGVWGGSGYRGIEEVRVVVVVVVVC